MKSTFPWNNVVTVGDCWKASLLLCYNINFPIVDHSYYVIPREHQSWSNCALIVFPFLNLFHPSCMQCLPLILSQDMPANAKKLEYSRYNIFVRNFLIIDSLQILQTCSSVQWFQSKSRHNEPEIR